MCEASGPRRADLIDIPAAVGMEAAAAAAARAESHGQIPSSRRAKGTTLSLVRPSPSLGAKSRAGPRAQIPSRRGLDDNSKKQLRTVSREQVSTLKSAGLFVLIPIGRS
jgi:hypothetical protein